MQQERRRTPRYPFIATAEVQDLSTKTTISARVTELSLYGCFVSMVQPLPQGTMIHVKVYSEGKFFEADGKVAYTAPNEGFGVSFQDVRQQFLATLKGWLIFAAQTKYGKKT